MNVPATLSDTGKRSQRFFPTRDKATEFSKTLRDNRKEFGQQSRALAPGISDDAVKALALLDDFGITLSECARFYVLHHDLRSKAPTLAVAWKKAREIRGDLSSRYRSTLKNLEGRLPPTFSAMNIVDITPGDISDALTAMTNGPTAWKSGLRIINAVLSDQVKQGTLKENPCSRVVALKVKNDDEVKIYAVEELKALFAACKPYDNGKDRECGECAVPFALLAFAGIRPTELTRLSWEDVSMENSSIRLSGKVTKTGKTRNVRINTTLKAWIETVPIDKRKGRVIPGRWIFKATRVRKEAGLDGREFQDALRHSYGSYKLATENDLDALKADMGHQHCDVFFNHYHNALTATAAAPYWEILPSVGVKL